jgi:hypothetical protein
MVAILGAFFTLIVPGDRKRSSVIVPRAVPPRHAFVDSTGLRRRGAPRSTGNGRDGPTRVGSDEVAALNADRHRASCTPALTKRILAADAMWSSCPAGLARLRASVVDSRRTGFGPVSRAGVTQLAECLLPKSEPPITPAPLVATPAFRPQLSAVARPRSQGVGRRADAALPGVAAVRRLAGVRHDRPTAVRRTSKPRLA